MVDMGANDPQATKRTNRGIHWPYIFSFSIVTLFVMGGLLVYLSSDSCQGSVVCIRRSIILATGGLLLAGALASWFTSKRIMEPVRQLTRVMQHITAGDWSVYILPQRHDEIGQLVQAFVDMREELGQELGTLSRQERQLSSVLTQMGDGVLIVDQSGIVRLINPAAARLLQTSDEAAIGRSFATVARHHELIEISQRSRDENKEQIAAIEIGGHGSSRTTPSTPHTNFWQVVVTPFTSAALSANRDEGSRGYLVMLHDLTHVRRLETVRRDFISNISHELRTPLASLRAVVETLQDGALTDPPAAERFLAHAANEVDLLTQMTEELLELSRIESGRVPLQLAPTAVIDLLVPAVKRMRRQAKRNKLKLKLELPSDLPLVAADADRITQVVTILLHNAIKFTPPKGQITITAGVEAWQAANGEWHPVPGEAEAEAEAGTGVLELSADPASRVVIKVSDAGVGIPAEDLPRIFERFFKSDRARTQGSAERGTGLGLAIAQNIVELHHGRIWVESKVGKGSSFYFSLPVSKT